MCRWYSDIQRLRIAELNNLNKRIITIKTVDLISKIKDQKSELKELSMEKLKKKYFHEIL